MLYLAARSNTTKRIRGEKSPLILLPSDLSRLVNKEVTASVEGQGYSLIKELRAAGYAINV